MRLITPSLEVAPDDAFNKDIFERKNFGEALLNIVSNSNDALVISIDGKWGEGKTTFVKMWQGLLNSNGIPNIYIDAFANDYIDDAFISIASSITSYAESNVKQGKEEKIEEFIEKTKKVGGKVLSWSARVGIKAVTLGIIKDSDIDSLKDIQDEISDSASSAVSEYIEERIASHSKDIQLIDSFKELLSTLPSKLQDETKNPLVIIIDELDRCKPTFAIEILEKIKHLFSTKNIVFVLVINKSQLEESLRCIYGQNIDSHSYLQKFINLETSLPKETTNKYSNDYKKYINKLFVLHEAASLKEKEAISDCLEVISIHFNLSLRQLERTFTNVIIYYASLRKDSSSLPQLVTFLCAIKTINPSLYNDIFNKKVSFSDLVKAINFPYTSHEDNFDLNYILHYFRYFMISEKELSAVTQEDRIFNFGRTSWGFRHDRESLIPAIAKRINIFTPGQ